MHALTCAAKDLMEEEGGSATDFCGTPRGVPVASVGRSLGGLLTPVPEAPLSPTKSSREEHWQEVAVTSMCYCRDSRNLAACMGASEV
jgi:hypothetical protein